MRAISPKQRCLAPRFVILVYNEKVAKRLVIICIRYYQELYQGLPINLNFSTSDHLQS